MLYVEFVIIKYRIVYGLDFKYFNYKKINLILKDV